MPNEKVVSADEPASISKHYEQARTDLVKMRRRGGNNVVFVGKVVFIGDRLHFEAMDVAVSPEETMRVLNFLDSCVALCEEMRVTQ